MRRSSLPLWVHVALAVATLAATLGVWYLARPYLLAAFLDANEKQAVADLLEFARAEDLFMVSAYDAAGAAGTPDALADPRRSPLPGQTTLHPRFLWPVRNGYRFEFQAMPVNAEPSRSFRPEPPRAFAYVAWPAIPGRTGQRSFLYDGAGRMVHARSDGLDPRLADPVIAVR